MDYSSTVIVEHTIFSILKEIQMINSIKRRNILKIFILCRHTKTSRISLWISTIVTITKHVAVHGCHQ